MSGLGRPPDADTPGSIIDSTLAQLGCTFDRPAPSAWRATACGGAEFTIKVEDSWLTLDRVAAGDIGAQPHLTLLARAAALPANTKLVAVGPDDRIHWRAELPLDADLDLNTQIPATIGAFAAVDPDGAETSLDADDSPAAPGDDQSSTVADSCAEGGWPAVERPDGTLVVELEVPGSFVQATVRCQENGASWVDVPVAPADATPDICGAATVRLLLRVSGLVRLVQAVLTTTSGAASPGFRVRLPPAASSAAFGHAFAALSVACRLCAREAAVLWHDERVARAYLGRMAPARQEDGPHRTPGLAPVSHDPQALTPSSPQAQVEDEV